MSAVYTVDGALAAVGVHETGQRRGRIKAGILLACEMRRANQTSHGLRQQKNNFAIVDIAKAATIVLLQRTAQAR